MSWLVLLIIMTAVVTPAAQIFHLKLLTKPTHFDGDPRGWPVWSFAFENWLICHNAEFETEMTAAVGGAVTVYAVSDETKARSVQLYAIMAGMLTGRALAILKSVPGRNGYGAFRQLYQSCAPKSYNRHLALLMSVTQAAAFSGSDEFVTMMFQWEEQVNEYELVSSQKLADDVKRAVLLKNLPLEIRSQVMYNTTATLTTRRCERP